MHSFGNARLKPWFRGCVPIQPPASEEHWIKTPSRETQYFLAGRTKISADLMFAQLQLVKYDLSWELRIIRQLLAAPNFELCIEFWAEIAAFPQFHRRVKIKFWSVLVTAAVSASIEECIAMKKHPFALAVLLCTLITPLSATLKKPSIGGRSCRRCPDLFGSAILALGHWRVLIWWLDLCMRRRLLWTWWSIWNDN